MKKEIHTSANLDRIVYDIIAAMSLKEKSLIANMDEKSLPYLQYVFDVYISKNAGDDAKMGGMIMRRVWQVLQATHRIRLVKGGPDG